MCCADMNPDKLLKKQQLQRRKSSEAAKKPLVNPVVRHLENERRSRSPLLKDISMLSKKSLQREVEATRRRQLNTLVYKSYKHRDLSPASRSKSRPTPTLSARRKSIMKRSTSGLRPSDTHTKAPKASTDKPIILMTKTEKRVNTPLPEESQQAMNSLSSEGRRHLSSGKKGQQTRDSEQQSDRGSLITPTSYLEQRRSHHKRQQSDSKPQNDGVQPQTGNRGDKRQGAAGGRTGPSSQSINRRLKYEEAKRSSPGRDMSGKQIATKQASPQSTKKAGNRDSSGKIDRVTPGGSTSSVRYRPVKVSAVDVDKRRAEEASAREAQKKESRTEAQRSSPKKNLNEERDQRRLMRTEMVRQPAPEIIELTPNKLVDSLELVHSSVDPRPHEARQPSSKIGGRVATLQQEETAEMKEYDTIHSEVSFSGHKTDIDPIDTPKFDSGVQQMETGNMPTSGVSQKEIDRLCMIFKKVIVFYERIEELKNQVFADKEFRLCDHFWSFDFENKGYLTLNEFTQMFNSFNINIGKGEIVEYLKLSLKRPNINQTTRISESDIAKCFAPINPEGKLLMYCSNANRHQDMPQYDLSAAVAARLDEIVQLQIKMHCEVIKECKMLSAGSQKRLFAAISASETASWEDLTRFLNTHGVKFYEDDVIFIFREFNARHPKAMTEIEYLSFFRLYSTAGL